MTAELMRLFSRAFDFQIVHFPIERREGSMSYYHHRSDVTHRLASVISDACDGVRCWNHVFNNEQEKAEAIAAIRLLEGIEAIKSGWGVGYEIYDPFLFVEPGEYHWQNWYDMPTVNSELTCPLE